MTKASTATAPQMLAFGADFAAWADENAPLLRPLLALPLDFDQAVATSRELRKVLWESGWGRYGWPQEIGGLGGSSLNRSVIYEELFRRGWTGPNVFEHVEIIAPTIARFARPELAKDLLPKFLDGSEVWAQGFSEPAAGSDLASLTTKAQVDGDVLVVNGTKIWTSWAKWARWCLALVRTGTTEDRHRGLTMLVIDLTAPGVEVAPIRQANGTDELAQVFFDGVVVPHTHVVGEVGRGWDVAMYLLARERGTLSWMRHCGFRARLEEAHEAFGPQDDRAVGDFVAQWAALRATAAELLRRDGAGEQLGPESAFNKLLMTRAEQTLFNLLHDATGTRVALPVDDVDAQLQSEFLFSRIVTVYGGSQQMQLLTLAKHVLEVPRG